MRMGECLCNVGVCLCRWPYLLHDLLTRAICPCPHLLFFPSRPSGAAEDDAAAETADPLAEDNEEWITGMYGLSLIHI